VPKLERLGNETVRPNLAVSLNAPNDAVEYVLLADVNDSLADAGQLAKLLRGFKCKVNIIPYNPHPEAEFRRPSAAAIQAFQNECKRLGMSTYLRVPKGDDIDAACGQLANRSNGSPVVPLRIRKGPPPAPPVE
jgi:23S rRNA (adenine2503-C2)-methyltransferase